MRKQGEDCLKRGYGACRASGQVEDQRRSHRAADSPTEGREGGLLEAGRAHAFREAVDQALADDSRGFGGDVAKGETGAAGRDDKVRARGVAAKSVDDLIEFIRNGLHGRRWGAGCLKTGGDGGAGEVFLPAIEAAIADGDYDRVSPWGEDLVHGSSLRCGAYRWDQAGPCPAIWRAGMRR